MKPPCRSHALRQNDRGSPKCHAELDEVATDTRTFDTPALTLQGKQLLRGQERQTVALDGLGSRRKQGAIHDLADLA
jgi:hypothetical protein